MAKGSRASRHQKCLQHQKQQSLHIKNNIHQWSQQSTSRLLFLVDTANHQLDQNNHWTRTDQPQTKIATVYWCVLMCTDVCWCVCVCGQLHPYKSTGNADFTTTINHCTSNIISINPSRVPQDFYFLWTLQQSTSRLLFLVDTASHHNWTKTITEQEQTNHKPPRLPMCTDVCWCVCVCVCAIMSCRCQPKTLYIDVGERVDTNFNWEYTFQQQINKTNVAKKLSPITKLCPNRVYQDTIWPKHGLSGQDRRI